MSGWTVLTARGLPAEDYDRVRWDNKDPAAALEDLTATFEDDRRIREWTLDNPQIHAHLATGRYDFETAEEVMSDYSGMIRDAVVLGANDTSDMGKARYYPNGGGNWTHTFAETEHGHVGRRACAVMYAQHGIEARDPFHDWLGRFDEKYLENGKSMVDDE